jgi:hypothetical protein
MSNPDDINQAIDPETLEQIDGGNDWYGPCGCIETPFPPCGPTEPDQYI